MGDIHRCLPNIDVLISIFDILTSMVFFFKRQYFIDVRNKTSNIDKKKKQTGIQFPRDDVNGPSGKCTCIFGPDFADADRLIVDQFPLSAAALPSHLLLRFILTLSLSDSESELKVNRTEVKDFLLSMLLFLQSIDKSFWNL
jgi:hypothetical protein